MAVNGGKLPGPFPAGGGPDDQQANQQPVEDLGNVGAYQRSPDTTPHSVKYDPEKYRDLVRSLTNFSFIGIFALTVIVSLYAAIGLGGQYWANAKDLLQTLLPAETALIGSAVGFYFGSQTNKPDR